jgi:Zn-dependent M28 family amino/carboxypeptidase
MIRRLGFGLSLACASLAVACGGSEPPAPAATSSTPPGSGANAFAAPVTVPPMDGAAVLDRIKVMSSDEYGGRAPGTKGEDLTVAYLESQFKALGLKPGNPDGTYIQKVPLVGITPDPNTKLTVRKGAAAKSFRFKDDVVAWTKHVAPVASIVNSELVFVGYGVVAPEYNWDDYKGLDVTGKTLVMLVNDPAVPDPADPSQLDPKVFNGKAMTYYGRWTYKYEIGAQKKAAGVLIVHETGPAGYPFEVVQSKVAEQFDLVTPDKNMGRVPVEGWVTLDAAKSILSMAGQDFDALKKQAISRDFKPVPLGVTASMTLKNALRTIDSRNVVAKLEGTDPKLKDEYVVYSAHWDHLGVGPAIKGDTIYNGAEDNASGTSGMLEIARAFTKVSPPPKRSILFLAVTAEEQGLLGSQYYSVTPLYPLANTLANINIDGMNLHGRTKDLVLIGLGNSDLDQYAQQAASEQGRTIKGDPEPEKGFYYRSDHFNFAKLGVPALDPDAGTEYVGKPPDYGMKVRDDYTTNRYHKPQDDVQPDWDLSGAIEDLQLFFRVGYRVANADQYPEWKPGTEFRATRDKQLTAAGKR